MQRDVKGLPFSDFRVLTEDELATLLTVHGDDEEAVSAILAELESRDEPVGESGQLAELVRTERREGETLEQTVDRMYGQFTYERYLAAEHACHGHLLNKAGQATGIDPYSLFYGQAQRAAKYASRELLDWWQEHRRIIWIQFKADYLGRPADVRAAAEARRRAADYGL